MGLWLRRNLINYKEILCVDLNILRRKFKHIIRNPNNLINYKEILCVDLNTNLNILILI